ncbi:MAG TPA: hypothetical protein VFP47_10530 [Pyrinomonadaceae bacterium]|nr:hypothetical protein [Pyrinomonadaceae bacterium]
MPALSTTRPFVPVGLLTNELFSNYVAMETIRVRRQQSNKSDRAVDRNYSTETRQQEPCDVGLMFVDELEDVAGRRFGSGSRLDIIIPQEDGPEGQVLR